MNRLLLLLFFCAAQNAIAQPISWLTDCADKTFCLNPGSCTEGKVNIVVQATTNCGSTTIYYTYKIDLYNNGGIEVQGSTDTLLGNFPIGEHKITWRASDNCGQVIQCTYLIKVKDCNPPTLVCINGLTQTMDPPQCEATFDVDQFFISLADNCTPTNQIERGMRLAGSGTGFPTTQSLTFGICDNGLNLLEVWVRDAGGLTNSCSNYVLVQSSDPVCDCNIDSELGLAGCARSANDLRLSTYRVLSTVKSTAGVSPPITKIKTISTTDSCYALHVLPLPNGGDYQAVIRADRPDVALNGVTTFDLVLISKHILGIEPLTSAYQMEAADVNNSNSVTTFDIVETRKLILGINDTFQHVPAWRFVRPLPNPSNLGSYTALQDTYQLIVPNLQTDLSFQGFNFVGIKYGDVNYTAGLAGAPDDRFKAEPVFLTTEDRWLKAGETAAITFRLEGINTMDGWQIALSVDPAVLQLLSMDGVPESDYLLDGNELRAISYDGSGRKYTSDESLFVVNIKALQSVRLSQALRLVTEKLNPEAYVQGMNKKSERHPMTIRFGGQGTELVKSFSVSPNPFNLYSDFNIQLEHSASALLEIFTLDGRRVYAENYELEKGEQSIRVAAGSLPDGNLFVYRCWVNGVVFSGRLVRF